MRRRAERRRSRERRAATAARRRLKNGIDPRRSASLLDIFSCVFQGLIPWAAQLLLAGSLAKISPLEITINNWYCMLLAVAGILAIILGLPRIKARSTEA